MMTRNPIALALLVVVATSGCVANYKVVGSFDHYDEVFLGDVRHNLLTGIGHIVATGKNSGITCEGDSHVVYVPPLGACAGQRGKAPVVCTDGRRFEVDWTAKSCTSGYGQGTDKNGATFRFVFGLDESEAQGELARQAAQVASNPKLPAYRPKEFRERKGYSTGTGFFVTDTGLFVTNYHVVEDAETIRVVDTATGNEYAASLLRKDPANDIVVLRVDAAVPSLPIAPMFNARKGDEILVLGYPLVALQGQEQKATFGHVNSLSGFQDDIRFVQIDAAIQPGNSGSPLLNDKGEVVGVVTATLNQIVTLRESGSLPQNVNFAVKVDYLIPIVRATLNGDAVGALSSSTDREMADIIEASEGSVMLVIAE